MTSIDVLLPILLLLLGIQSAFAGSATWNLNPVDKFWNNASNWTPATIPNGPTDTASFTTSNQINVSLSADTTVDGIVFNAGASAFTIFAKPMFALSTSGTGITNNSGITQNFVTVGGNLSKAPGQINFSNSATAGSMTVFTNEGSATNRVSGGIAQFSGSSSAGSGTFINKGGMHVGPHSDAGGGMTFFLDNSTAANGTFINEPGRQIGRHFAGPGFTSFSGNSTAGNGTFSNNGSVTFFSGNSTAGNGTFDNNGGSTQFGGASTAGNGIFTNDNGFVEFANTATAGNGTFINNDGGVTDFLETATAGDGTFINNGGGSTNFSFGSPTAGNATLIANGGLGGGAGGVIQFFFDSTGGTARIEVFDNGALDISLHDAPGVSIGSIEGSGLVSLGAFNLTVGSNNLSTNFSGVIEDGGNFGGTGASLTKVGTSKLVLSGANTYTGGTTVNGGSLLAKNKTGSATGTGPVQVNSGTLLGSTGIIGGPVIVGTGAILLPGTAKKPGTLTINDTLAFNAHSTYECVLNRATPAAGKVSALGVAINSAASFSFVDTTSGTLTSGTVFTIISNTSLNPIAGTFSNLPDNSTFTSNGNTFRASYEGGDGNDLTLTVVP